MHEPDWPSVTHEPVWDLAPPAHVRRRGEVLARRRRGRASIVGLVLAAVVGSPLVGGWGSLHLAADPTPSSPRPARSSPPDEGTWVESVPEGFALGAGMPGESRSEVRRHVPICARIPGRRPGRVGRHRGGHGARRTARRVGDARPARLSQRVVGPRRGVRRPSGHRVVRPLDGGERMVVLGGDVGVVDESWGFSYAPTGSGVGDGQVLLVLRVGNSVLLDARRGGRCRLAGRRPGAPAGPADRPRDVRVRRRSLLSRGVPRLPVRSLLGIRRCPLAPTGTPIVLGPGRTHAPHPSPLAVARAPGHRRPAVGGLPSSPRRPRPIVRSPRPRRRRRSPSLRGSPRSPRP